MVRCPSWYSDGKEYLSAGFKSHRKGHSKPASRKRRESFSRPPPIFTGRSNGAASSGTDRNNGISKVERTGSPEILPINSLAKNLRRRASSLKGILFNASQDWEAGLRGKAGRASSSRTSALSKRRNPPLKSLPRRDRKASSLSLARQGSEGDNDISTGNRETRAPPSGTSKNFLKLKRAKSPTNPTLPVREDPAQSSITIGRFSGKLVRSHSRAPRLGNPK